MGLGRASGTRQRRADYPWGGRAGAAARRFFRNPDALVGRERLWGRETEQPKALRIDAKHPPIIPLAIAPPQPELVGPVLR